jgi:tetratricopeptide (TPR) repeat protein
MKWAWTTLAVATFSSVAMGQQLKLDARLIGDQQSPSTESAATQNSIGNTLKEQASHVEGPEAARLFGEAAAAYRRALLALTRDSTPQDWATTQHSLGYVLQEQGVRTNGPEAARLLSDAVAAYKQALQIRTREQLPLHWAMTQNDLGNAVQAQGARAEAPESTRLLAEAAAAYDEALLVFTREFMPRQWAMTQHNRGSALHEQGSRTDGLEGVKLLGEAVNAYRQALLVRTREQMPQQWAITQNNLANALQAQGTRADKPEALRLLDEALTAYRQSLLVFTREQTPRLWAMTKHNVGSALQEQGTRAEGAQEAQRMFGEAVAAYREALGVWTRQQLPQQWAMAQNNLARAYFNLKDWNNAAECYRSVLADESFDARIKVPIGALEIATLVALNRSAEVAAKLKSLIEMLEKQPANFRVRWNFADIQHVISQDPQFTAKREWLLQLFATMGGENRDAIVKRLRAVPFKP